MLTNIPCSYADVQVLFVVCEYNYRPMLIFYCNINYCLFVNMQCIVIEGFLLNYILGTHARKKF